MLVTKQKKNYENTHTEKNTKYANANKFCNRTEK